MHNVPFNTELTDGNNEEAGAQAVLKCPIPIQKETPKGLVDEICNIEAPNGYSGLCK